MKNAKLKNKHFFMILLLGFTVCLIMVLTTGITVYKFSGRDLKGKIKYFLKKGEENLKSYSQQKIVSFKRQVIHQKDDAEVKALKLTIEADHPLRKISPLIYGSNLTSKTEFEMDIAKFGGDIGITNVRFPGGSSMGYRWKLAKYDFEGRYDEAPLSNIENVIKFCAIINAQLVIQVNVESGTPEEAADWVRYMNKGIGNMRVDYWELGNEVYGDWDKAYMPGEDYVEVIKQYSTLMKQVDPAIKIGANWGGSRYEAFDTAVIQGAADYIDFISYHWYPNHVNKSHPYNGRTHPYPKEIMANSLAVGEIVNRFEDMVLKFAPRRQGKIEFTVMEWDGSWDAVPSDLEFEYRGMMWSLANAIFHADALGQFAQNGVTVANQYALQEVMHGLIRGWDREAGWGGSRWDGETIRPKALALKLFARHFGDILVQSTLEGSPSYNKEADWRADSYTGQVPYVTGYASISSGDSTMRIVLINKHDEKDFKVNISINGAIAEDKGEAWILNGQDLNAQNDGSPGVVAIKKYDLSDVKNKFSYNVPLHSVNLLKIPLKNLISKEGLK